LKIYAFIMLSDGVGGGKQKGVLGDSKPVGI